MSFESKPYPQSRSSKENKPENPAVARLAQQIFELSWNNAESLEGLIRAEEKERSRERWLLALCEFMYLFVHLTDRWSFRALGHEQRSKVANKLWPLVSQGTVEALWSDWPSDKKHELNDVFLERLNDAQLKYGECQQIFDTENSVSQDALFSRFAANVCKMIGIEKSAPTKPGQNFAQVYGRAFGTILELAFRSFKELNLPDTVRAIEREL